MQAVQSVLMDYAEVAIALAGFSAIVVMLKRHGDGLWSQPDADRFHGMVLHAIGAVGFCFVPSVIDLLVQDVSTSLHIACAMLGVQIVAHSLGVLIFKFPGRIGLIAMSVGLLVGLAQFAAFSDWGVNRELSIYVVGIIWHLMQAGLLFVLLIWIPRQHVDPEPVERARSDG